MLEIPRSFMVSYALLDQRCPDRQHRCPTHPGIRWSRDGNALRVEFLDRWVETLSSTIAHSWWPSDLYDTKGEPIPPNTVDYLSALGSMTPWDLDRTCTHAWLTRVLSVGRRS